MKHFNIKRDSGRQYKVVGKSGMLYTEGSRRFCKNYIDMNYSRMMSYEEWQEAEQERETLRLQEQNQLVTADRGYREV